MSDSPDDERLEELRKQKMQEMQEQGEQEEAQQQAQQQADAQKQALLRKYLTDGARKRLNSVRMSKPDFADRVEQQILALAQSGRVNGQIDEDKMKELLRELKPDSKSFNIRRR
ncbi:MULTISPECIES: DNA-binding protein [Halorussus]|uniref:DNA-binding protein n=1 Tax=Halorussus TaxID=1070314 RepID=UPI00209FE15F|nr:DNA-binding protein [Halorussus vallis]USZ73805.1 DNA-binding protein [Halorussus vallis]